MCAVDDDFGISILKGRRLATSCSQRAICPGDPGNDLNLAICLTTLNGEGNDAGFINNQINNLEDNDELGSASTNNDGSSDQSGSANGGSALLLKVFRLHLMVA
jgi:hypothetical protein